MLADGTSCSYDNFGAEVEWHGNKRGVLVSALGNEALVGMVLLAGHRLTVDVEPGGEVTVQPLRL